MWFELYKDSCPVTETPWRWRLRDNDGQAIALGVAAYATEEDCRRAVGALKLISHLTPIETRQSHAGKGFPGKDASSG